MGNKCEHGKRIYFCKICNMQGICKHNVRVSTCKDCRTQKEAEKIKEIEETKKNVEVGVTPKLVSKL